MHVKRRACSRHQRPLASSPSPAPSVIVPLIRNGRSRPIENEKLHTLGAVLPAALGLLITPSVCVFSSATGALAHWRDRRRGHGSSRHPCRDDARRRLEPRSL